MPTFKFVFNRRKKATECIPASVELEIYFDRSHRKRISTGVRVCLGQWDDRLHVVNRPDSLPLNSRLMEVKKQFEEDFCEMYSCGVPPSYTNYEYYTTLGMEKQAESPTSFLDFMQQRIEERNLREGTKKTQLVALEALRRFGKIQTFSSLTPANLYAFDIFLRKENPDRVQTTIHNYHKRIKPYVNEAYRLEYIKVNPYAHFVDKRGKCKERRPLTREELHALMELNLSGKLERVRDLFVFCCFTGLSYSDMCSFDYDKQVISMDGMQYIDSSRIKTGTAYFTPLLKPARNILSKYGYRLPLISVQKYNDYLHVLEDKLGLNKPITSHLARHTFATTVCLANGVPIETVSRMLGHRHITTTEIYAKILKENVEKSARNLEKIFENNFFNSCT